MLILVLIVIWRCRELWLTDSVYLHVCSVSIPPRPMFVDGQPLHYSHAR